MNILIGIAVFITVILLIEGADYLLRSFFNRERRRIRKLTERRYNDLPQQVDLVRKQTYSDIPWFNRLLNRVTSVRDLAVLLERANVSMAPGVFVLIPLLAAGFGFLVGLVLSGSALLGAMFALGGSGLPFVFLIMKKGSRVKKFQRQLPEALDMLGRSLRAGHAFMTGMQLVGEEFPDPIGPEFQRTIDEINFGIAAQDALESLAKRVDCKDLSFFVTSVLVQRETGGDLAEIIENIGRLIRKRYELFGRITALAAEGKMSAYVLIGLPFFIVGAILVLNPTYLVPLYKDPMGQAMVAFATFMMVLGIAAIAKMIKIKV
jgi:tight adherence protein B